jgi:hypothetical protein
MYSNLLICITLRKFLTVYNVNISQFGYVIMNRYKRGALGYFWT